MARPKVIVQIYPMFPARDEEDRKAKRPLGRDRVMYQKIVHEWVEILKAAEQMGVWGAATIEHHLHSEGYEVGPNPGILNAYWASQLKKMHIGALGYVMATQDPIRVAEETAILDHLTRGRFFVGLARGYQSRWTNILGQFTNSVATVSDGSPDDKKNRDVFEERVEMLLECWQNDSVVLDGQYYQAPYPIKEGIANYPARNITQTAGAHGEVDANGVIRRISVCPAPYQRPHPPVLVATSKSDDSILYCARKGFIPTYFSKFETVVRQSELYVQEAAKHGRSLPKGAAQNIVRWVHIADSEADYHRKLREYEVDIYKNFYSTFFPQFAAVPHADWVQNIKDSGIYVGGTIEQVRSQWQEMYKSVPAEYITLIFHYAQQPKSDVLATLERFMEEVVPHLDANEAPATLSKIA
jgi:alkanesulfonate monooxygenase SsuD/methylene tetrahydromethanopterin reductase-like flavin-dependent oxidoreductase (luciferase family)